MNHCNLIFLILMSTNVLLGMNQLTVERRKKRSLSTYTAPMSSKIMVIKDDLYNTRLPHADITVVGNTEQCILKNELINFTNIVGTVNWQCNKTKGIKVKKASFAKIFDPEYGFQEDSAAIIVDGERYVIQNPYAYIEDKKIDSTLICVVEPQVFIENNNDGEKSFFYKKAGSKITGSSELETLYYSGNAAVEEALKDLGMCYKFVLDTACVFFTEHHAPKSIAFPQLSISLGIDSYKAAHVALASIVEYVQNGRHKDNYKLIELFVRNREEYNLYRTILRSMHEQSNNQCEDLPK